MALAPKYVLKLLFIFSAKAIFKAGYAEAVKYEDNLNNLIRQYNLKELDKIVLSDKKSKLLPVLIIAGSIYLIYLGIKK